MDYKLKERPEYKGYPLLLFSTVQGDGSDQPHRHDFVEISLVRSGYTTHCIYDEEKTIIHRGTIIHGDLYVIPPGVRHQFQNKQNVMLYTMAFLPELFSAGELEVLTSLAPLKNLLGGSQIIPVRLHLLPLEFARMERILQKVISELACPMDLPVHRLLAKTLVLVYLIAIGNHAPEYWSSAPENADEKILQAISDMENFPQKEWSLSGMAKKYGECASGFGRKFREVTGIPPMQYCQLLRLERVREALITTPESIEVLAEKYGFSDSNHLIKVFKKRYGVTPSLFRRRRKNG